MLLSLLPAGAVACPVLSGDSHVVAGTHHITPLAKISQRQLKKAQRCAGTSSCGVVRPLPGAAEAGCPHASPGRTGIHGIPVQGFAGVSPFPAASLQPPPLCPAPRVCSSQHFPLSAASQTSLLSLPSPAAAAWRCLSLVVLQNI